METTCNPLKLLPFHLDRTWFGPSTEATSSKKFNRCETKFCVSMVAMGIIGRLSLSGGNSINVSLSLNGVAPFR